MIPVIIRKILPDAHADSFESAFRTIFLRGKIMQVRLTINKLKIGMILLCAVMAAGIFSMQTKAEGENKFSDIAEFTEISLWNAGDGIKIEGQALLEKDVNLELRCNYMMKDGEIENITANTPYYLEVSPHLVLPGSSPLTCKIEGLDPVEFGSICSAGTKVWIEFKANEDGSGTALAKLLADNDLEDFQGNFYLQCGRAEAPPETKEDNRYTMEVEGRELFSFGYKELERTEKKAEIEKKGSLQGRTVTWTIQYTPWQNPNPDGPDKITADTAFELRDTIDGAKHSFVEGSIEIGGSKVTEYAPGDQVPEDAESYAVIEKLAGGTVLNIGGRKLCAGNAAEGNPAQPIHITYQTTLRDELLLPGNTGKPKVGNTAKLWAEKEGSFQELGIGGNHEITVEPLTWIEKDGTTTRKNGKGSYTKWTITFNPNGFTFPMGSELTLHDQLPEGSTLDKDSIEIDGTKADAKNIKTEEGNRFSVSVDQAVTQPVVITYRTTVTEEMYESGINLGENTAWFTFRYEENKYETPQATKPVGSGDGSGTPGTALLVKSNGGYQSGSRSIAWTVDINPHRAYLKSGTFTDNLGETAGGSCNIPGHKKGLELADGVGGVEVLLDGPAAEAEKEELAKRITLNYTDQVLTVTVGDIGYTKVTLHYTTKVCDPCIYANNTNEKQFKNRISTDNMVIGENSTQARSASGESTVNVSATVLTKKAPVYDYGSGVMQWTMEVNAAGLLMKDIVLTDKLPAGLTYADGDGTFQSGAGSNFRTEPAMPGATLTVSESGKNLTITLGDIGTTKILVIFQTRVDPMEAGFNSDKDVEIVNTAVMNGRVDDGTVDGIVFEKVCDAVSQNFVNHGLVKSSTTNNKEEWIDYEVLINPFGLSLPQTFSLTDTLDGRLQLDGDTLRAYRATVSGTSGTAGQKPNYVIKTDEPPLKIDGYDYDPETNSFTVKFRLPESSAEEPAPEKCAYLLTYRADIVERQAGGYGNSVRFEGGDVKLGGIKQSSAQVSGGGGGGSGVASRRVSITVTHTDSVTGAPLSGVTYTLYEWDMVNNRRIRAVAQGITNAQGVIIFKVKPDAVYELVQTKGISGYDDVPGWDQLPEGVLQGGKGLLVTAETAGSKRELKLTNKVSVPGDPDAGDTGDAGNGGSGGHTGEGGDGNQTDNSGDNNLKDDREDVGQTDNIEEESYSEHAAEDGTGDNGAAADMGEKGVSVKKVKSPQTGDGASQPEPWVLFWGMAAASIGNFLCRRKESREKR